MQRRSLSILPIVLIAFLCSSMQPMVSFAQGADLRKAALERIDTQSELRSAAPAGVADPGDEGVPPVPAWKVAVGLLGNSRVSRVDFERSQAKKVAPANERMYLDSNFS